MQSLELDSGYKKWWRSNQQKIAPWLFLFPAILFFTLYVIAPIFQSMWYSLFAWDGIGAKEWIGFANYIELLDDDRFYTSLKNNVIWLALFMLAVPIGLFVALFLNQTIMGMRFYKSMFFFPFVISQVVVGLIFSWFYNPNFGIIGQIWNFFGAEAPSILGDEDLVTYGIIFAGLWPQVSYCMILYLTGLNNVSQDQIEAGRLDGAKGWRMLRHVILPQLWPATFLAIVITVIGALRSFDMIAIMTQGGPYGSSNVLSYFMFETALSEYGFRMGYGSAIAVILFLIMLLFIGYFLWVMYNDEKRG
jgi:multiple sugar transport system permease protein